MAHVNPVNIYQNKVINRAISTLKLPYSENKEMWVKLFAQITKRDITGLSDMTLQERRKLIKHFNSRFEFSEEKNLFNPYISKGDHDWKKGDPDTLPENVARPIHVGKSKLPYISKISAILTDLKLPWGYVDKISKSRFGREIVEWCTQDEIESIAKMMIFHQKRQNKG